MAKNVVQVSDPAALTAPATFNATTYTPSELNKLRADVAALQVKLTAVINLLQSMSLATS